MAAKKINLNELKDIIKKMVKEEGIENFSSAEDWIETDKWSNLEREVRNAIIPIIEKHKENFGNDSYAVIDAVQQIFDGLFEKVKRE